MKTKLNKINTLSFFPIYKYLLWFSFVHTIGISTAQTTTVTVGTVGTSTSTFFGPIYRTSGNSTVCFSKHAYLYTLAELTNAGITTGSQITDIRFTKNSSFELSGLSTGTISIYMKNSSNTQLVSGTTWGSLTTNATLCENTEHSTTQNIGGVGTVTYLLSAPFTYTGGSLEVYVEWNLNPGFLPYTTGGFQWLYATYPGTVKTIGAVGLSPLGTATPLSNLTYGGTVRPNTQLSYTQTIPCIGAPAPGNTVASATVVCPFTTIQLSLQNIQTQNGASFQWYDSVTGPIVGATNALYTPNITTHKTFYCGVTCAGMTTYSNPVTITIQSYLDCYCISEATSIINEDITSVTVNGTTHSSTCATTGTPPSVVNRYSDYTSVYPAFVLPVGQIIPVSLTITECNTNGFNNTTSIWIDYDHSGIFDTSERVYSTFSLLTNTPYYFGGHIESGNFTLPTTALPGITRMRILCNETTSPTTNPCLTFGWGETEDYLVDIQLPNTTLLVTCFIEAYMTGPQTMTSVLANQGEASTINACDSIDIELHEAFSPFATAYTCRTVLHQNGFITALFPPITGSYYIVVKHRNALETWSSQPLGLTSGITSYNFSTDASQAFGNNQVETTINSNVYALYSGDMVVDQNIDLLDLSILQNHIALFASGYLASDINGDGNVDLLDMPVIERNITNFVFSNHP